MTITQLSRISRCYHGLNSKEMRTLGSSVLKPRVLFGSIVWFNTRTEGKVSNILKLLQNAANWLILGAFKSSPVDLMNHDTNEISFKDLAIRYHHNYIYKKLTAAPHHPARQIIQQELLRTPTTHLSPIHRLLHQTDLILPSSSSFETIYPYPDPPWVEPRWVVENIGVPREEVKAIIVSQIEEEKKCGACVIFTDGSFIPDVGGGAAIAMEGKTASNAYGPNEGISNYEMEAMAIMIALVHFRHLISTHPDKFTLLAIFSDSQTALDLFSKPLQPKTLQYLAHFLLRSYREIPTNYHVRLFWTPGHEGVELNEAADEAARKAAEEDDSPIILPMSLGALLRHTKTLFHHRGAVPINPYKKKARWITDALNLLEKGDAAAIFQLRCGHCPLKKFLHRIRAEEDAKCDECFATETPAHFLIYCKKYNGQRRTFRRQLREENIKVDINSA